MMTKHLAHLGAHVVYRQTSEMLLNALAPVLPELVGGSADLTGSNLTCM